MFDKQLIQDMVEKAIDVSIDPLIIDMGQNRPKNEERWPVTSSKLWACNAIMETELSNTNDHRGLYT